MHSTRAKRDGRRAAAREYWRDVVGTIAARCWRGRLSLVRLRQLSMDLVVDIGEGSRRLLREPRFLILAVLTTAVGVGAAGAVFALANQLLLRPLPGTAGEGRVAYLQFRPAANPASTRGQSLSLPDFDVLRQRAGLLEGMASYERASLNVQRRGSRPRAIRANIIHGDFFQVLGVAAVAGRLLDGDETGPGGEADVAVIASDLAITLYGSPAAAVGRTLLANRHPVTIVGVAAPGFRGPERGDSIDLWLPHSGLVTLFGFPAEVLTSRESAMHRDLLVRLRDSVDVEEVEAQLSRSLLRVISMQEDPAEAERLSGLAPQLFQGLHIPPMIRASTYHSMRVMATVAILVLLVACANVGGLHLSRNLRRRQGMATRRALGASPGRIVRYHLSESVLLAVLSTGAGVGVAWLIILLLRGEKLANLPPFEALTVDVRLLPFAFLASLLPSLLFGVVPAALAGRVKSGTGMSRGRSGQSRSLAATLRVLSAAQVGLSLTLLVGGTLLFRTVVNLYGMPMGSSVDDVSALRLDRPDGQLDPAARNVHAAVLGEVRKLPGVSGAALTAYAPHGARIDGRIAMAGTAPQRSIRADMTPVTDGWFDALDVQMVRGGPGPTWDRRKDGPVPTILTAALARRLFGHVDVIGTTIRAGFDELEELEIVGVTEELRMANAPDEPYETFFVPFTRSPLSRVTLLVERRGEDPASAEGLRTTVEGLLPDQPVPFPERLSDRVDQMHSGRRVLSRLLGMLSLLAVTLAAVGLYGTTAFAVAGRTREFAVRLALGAGGPRIVRMVLLDAATILLSGIAIGLLGAHLLSEMIADRLFGVGPLDPLSWAAAVALLGGVVVVACTSPARAAGRVDPVEALRADP